MDKVLGLETDRNLSWNLHSYSIVAKTSSGIFPLSRLKNLLEIESLKMVYFSYIHSVIPLEYHYMELHLPIT